MNQHRITSRLVCFGTICFLAGCNTGQWDSAAIITPQDAESFGKILKQKKEAIEAEILALGPGHPWAGSYRAPQGYVSFFLLIAPKGGFVVKGGCCLGGGAGYGAVKDYGQVLRLNLNAFQNDGRYSPENLKHLQVIVPILWGPRHYLVAQSKLDHFKGECYRGNEPRKKEQGFHLLREGDWNFPVKGSPVIPE